MHAACLRSFVRHGHDVVLHSYDKPVDMPAGVRFFNASKLMREDEVFAHKSTGSLALASDIYRYRILREGMGIYVDCDVYCIKPFYDAEFIYSYQCNRLINGAILKMPYNSELLIEIMRASEDKHFIPPWYSDVTQFRYKVKKMIGMPKHVSKHQWGVLGPDLITYYVKKFGLEHWSAPIDQYSPVHSYMTNLFFEEGLGVKDIITPRTIGLHLYSSSLKDKISTLKKNSPLYEIIHS